MGTVFICPMHPAVRSPAPGSCPDCGMALEPAVPGVVTTVEYTCPMHPEIVRHEPGTCPICGMALEPRTVTLEEPPNPELVDMTRRFGWSIAPTGIVVLLGMAEMFHGNPLAHALSGRALQWVELVLATPVVVWAGWPFFERGAASIVRRSLNMFTLIALGTGAAYVFSLVATVAPSLFPASLRGMDGTVGVYFEAAAGITVLVLVGQVLELRARSQTGHAIRSLLQLTPRTARRLRADGGSEEDVPLDQVQPGSTACRVRPRRARALRRPRCSTAYERSRRVDDHRGALARGQSLRRRRDGRNGQRDGQHAAEGRAGRGRHAPRADRASRQRGAAEPSADPAPRRSRVAALTSSRP